MRRAVAKTQDMAPGGLRAYDVDGREILIANDNGVFYAVERRCGHMNAPCELGTLRGRILTCPMHFAQFDITTGKVLKKPFIKSEPQGLPEKYSNFIEHRLELVSKITTCELKTFPVSVQSSDIFVDVT
jgi:nitrite reductase/ring-hydroxylating ferredoxin subunit